MERFADQTHYQVLEIPDTATKDQIEKAYQLARVTYGERSLAAYSLFTREDLDGIRKRVEEAYGTLINEDRRRNYHRQLGLPVPGARPLTPAAEPEGAAPGLDLATMDEINGAALAQIRARRGIPLQEVAARTRINITYLQYIEEDRYPALPAPVYLRSYLVQYARVLGLDATQVADKFLRAYQRHLNPAAPPTTP